MIGGKERKKGGGERGREGERERERGGEGEREREREERRGKERGRENREQTSLQTGQGVFFLPHKSSCSLNWSIGNDCTKKNVMNLPLRIHQLGHSGYYNKMFNRLTKLHHLN